MMSLWVHQPLQNHGRPVGTRTPDLYRVNYSRRLSRLFNKCHSTQNSCGRKGCALFPGIPLVSPCSRVFRRGCVTLRVTVWRAFHDSQAPITYNLHQASPTYPHLPRDSPANLNHPERGAGAPLLLSHRLRLRQRGKGWFPRPFARHQGHRYAGNCRPSRDHASSQMLR